MSGLAEKLYRAFVFGEELDDEWGEEVLATAKSRRVSLDQVILEAVEEAEARVKGAGQAVPAGRGLREAA